MGVPEFPPHYIKDVRAVAWSPDSINLVLGSRTGEIEVEDPLLLPNIQLSPTSNAGPDQALTDTDGNGSEVVTLDGSASSDPDGTIVSYSWSENDIEIATGVSPQVSLSVGVHTITLTVTDDDGLTDTDEVVITVNPAPTMPGTGLRGQYFDALNFATLKFFRIVPTVDFNWGPAALRQGPLWCLYFRTLVGQ